jgi:hypothetical protein
MIFSKRAVILGAAVSMSMVGIAPQLSQASSTTSHPQSHTNVAMPRLARPPLGHGSVELSWRPAYMTNSHKFTQAQAVAMAKRNNLIIGAPAAFKNYTSAMRAANPHLTLLAYTDATFQSGGEVRALPDSEFAHDTNGNRIKSRGFGTYLMNPSSPAWQAAATTQCARRALSAHLDGCFLDMLTMGIFSKGYTSSMPMNPATHRTYTEKAWRHALVGLARAYSAREPHFVLVGNAVSNASRYWSKTVSSRPLAMALPAAQTEDFLRSSIAPVSDYPNAVEWRHNVHIVTNIEASGHTGLYSTKLWSGASPSQVAAWESYAMATFLMGADGHSFFAFTDSRTLEGATGLGLPYRMPKSLGAPTNAMHRVGHIYRRHFRGGRVVVNPHGVGHYVRFKRHFRDLQGNRVSRLWMPAHSGNIFLLPHRFHAQHKHKHHKKHHKHHKKHHKHHKKHHKHHKKHH